MSCDICRSDPLPGTGPEKPISRFMYSEDGLLSGGSITVHDGLQKYLLAKKKTNRGKKQHNSGQNRSKKQSGGLNISDLLSPYQSYEGHWIHVERFNELDNKEAYDRTWNDVIETPCWGIERNTRKMTKLGKGNCGKSVVNQETQRFNWENVWLIMLDREACRINDPELYATMESVCRSSFVYHCVRPGGGGIDGSYFDSSWEDAHLICVFISDCGQEVNSTSSLTTPTCNYLVLAVSLLQRTQRFTLSDKVIQCERDVLIEQPWNPVDHIYMDIVCSSFRTGTNMINIFVRNDRPVTSTAWQHMLFKRSNVDYVMCLRAISPVYSYYSANFGFIRSVDGKYVFPAYYVNPRTLIQSLKKFITKYMSSVKSATTPLPVWLTEFYASTLSTSKLYEPVIFNIFGPAQVHGEIIWSPPTGQCYIYKVYRLTKTFTNFLIFMVNATKDFKILNEEIGFRKLEMTAQDSDINGFLFTKYIHRNQ